MPQPALYHRETVQRAVQGDRTAWHALLEQHGPMVWGICRRLGAQPEDAYQDVWAKVFTALHRYDPDGRASLKTWIATIAHRHLIDCHRRRQVRGEVVPLDGLSGIQADPEGVIDSQRRETRLEEAIRLLPISQRSVVVAHHLDDLPLDVIAAEQGIAIGTVKSRLHRARARLAELLRGSP